MTETPIRRDIDRQKTTDERRSTILVTEVFATRIEAVQAARLALDAGEEGAAPASPDRPGRSLRARGGTATGADPTMTWLDSPRAGVGTCGISARAVSSDAPGEAGEIPRFCCVQSGHSTGTGETSQLTATVPNGTHAAKIRGRESASKALRDIPEGSSIPTPRLDTSATRPIRCEAHTKRPRAARTAGGMASKTKAPTHGEGYPAGPCFVSPASASPTKEAMT